MVVSESDTLEFELDSLFPPLIAAKITMTIIIIRIHFPALPCLLRQNGHTFAPFGMMDLQCLHVFVASGV